jgi:chemotaxis protein methyltransferase CheR
MGTYIERMKCEPIINLGCKRLMTVSISRFFRDRGLWQILEETVLTGLLERESPHIWSAGCARGEEVYSLNILLYRLNKKHQKSISTQILATDVNPDYIEKAQKAIYTASSMREVHENWRDLYFTEKRKNFEVQQFLKQNITWKVQPFESGLPKIKFDIIFLRNNLLTYYLDSEKTDIFRSILRCLKPSGWLIIGSNEHLPFNCSDLKPWPSCPYLYKKPQ